MSMNKYISGIINCLDTVPSLKKQLVKAFKKVEEDLNGKETQFKSIDFTTTTSDAGTGTILNTAALSIIYIDCNNPLVICLPFKTNDNQTRFRAIYSDGNAVGSTSISGTAYYL